MKYPKAQFIKLTLNLRIRPQMFSMKLEYLQHSNSTKLISKQTQILILRIFKIHGPKFNVKLWKAMKNNLSSIYLVVHITIHW